MQLCQVVYDESEVQRILSEIGVPLDRILQALNKGLLHALSCTSLHTPSASGTYMYQETTAGLRDSLSSLGWQKQDKQNYSLIKSPDGKRAIVVASADEYTGQLSGPQPSTRSEKGLHAAMAIGQNNQMSFIGEGFEIPISNQQWPISTQETYYLLTYRNDRQLRSELSLPNGQSPNGRINSWSKRIILPSISFDSEIDIKPEFAPQPQIQIKRKS